MTTARLIVGGVGLAVYGVGALVALFFPIAGGTTSEIVGEGLSVLDWLTAYQLGVVDLEILANVLIFVPIGVFGAMLLPRGLWWVAVLAGAALSAAAEVFQSVVLSSRVGSIRDVVLNIAGTLIGALATWVVRRVSASHDHRHR
jgi:glycopeptide antibiotics resistance protein